MSDLTRELIRLLVQRHGAEVVVRLVREESDNGPGKPPRRRRTLSRDEAARRAAALVPEDELARARAKRGR